MNNEVLYEQVMTSDHYPIKIILNMQTKYNENYETIQISSDEPRYNYIKANWSSFKSSLNQKLKLITDKPCINVHKPFQKNPLSSKPWWQRINKFRRDKVKKRYRIPKLIEKEEQVTNDKDKAELFAKSLA